jgi:NAD(P)-dependent dehydrogenase (short-subunit alcohol dehydrogenase family)
VAEAILKEERRARAMGRASDPEHARSLVAESVAASGPDVAVANAGFAFADFFATTPAEFDRVTALNLRGAIFLAQAAARQMREQGQADILLCLVCATAIRSGRLQHVEGRLEMLAKGLCLSRPGITVNAGPRRDLTRATFAQDPGW